MPGPGPSLWLSDWDPGRLRSPRANRGEDPCPPCPPRRKGGPGNYRWIDCPPPIGSRALGRAVGRAWMESEARTREARTCQPPPSLALAVWFGAHHVSIIFKNLISCQHLQIGELHRKVRISVLREIAGFRRLGTHAAGGLGSLGSWACLPPLELGQGPTWLPSPAGRVHICGCPAVCSSSAHPKRAWAGGHSACCGLAVAVTPGLPG